MQQKFSRQILATALTLSFFSTIQAQHKYTIRGEIDGAKGNMMIRITNYHNKSRDSAIAGDGKFILEGTIDQPSKVYISISHIEPQPVEMKIGSVVPMQDGQMFFLAEGTTTIKGKDLASAIISNPVQKEYLDLHARLQPTDDAINAMQGRIYMNRDNDSAKYLKSLVKPLYDQRFQVELQFIKQHPDSYVSMDLVSDQFIVVDDAAKAEQQLNALSPRFRNSTEGIKMANTLAVAKRLSVGQPLIEFTQNDVNGTPVSLASLKGKYILVDFWASWCGPCKMEYPWLHKAYDTFKGKNFEIIGVSLDNKKDAWVKSIKENDFHWLLVCDLKGFNNEAALAYGVHAIPQSFLIDPQGIIIAKNLRGNDLLEKLHEVIKP